MTSRRSLRHLGGTLAATTRTSALLVLALACAVLLASCGGGSQSQTTREAAESIAEQLARPDPGLPPGGTRITGFEAEEVADAVRGYVGDLRVDGWLEANPIEQDPYSEVPHSGLSTEDGIRACHWLSHAAQHEAIAASEGAATTCGPALKQQAPLPDDMEVGSGPDPRIPALFEWNIEAPGSNDAFDASYAQHIDEATSDYAEALEEVPVTAYRQQDDNAIAVIGMTPTGWRLAQENGSWKIDSLAPVELTPESSPPYVYSDTMRACIGQSPLVAQLPEEPPENVPYPYEQQLEEAGLNETDTMEMTFIHTQEDGRQWGVPSVGVSSPYDSFNFTTVENNSGGGATVSVLDLGTESRAKLGSTPSGTKTKAPRNQNRPACKSGRRSRSSRTRPKTGRRSPGRCEACSRSVWQRPRRLRPVPLSRPEWYRVYECARPSSAGLIDCAATGYASWREEGLRVPRKAKKRRRLGESTTVADRLKAKHPNHVWALDYHTTPPTTAASRSSSTSSTSSPARPWRSRSIARSTPRRPSRPWSAWARSAA